MSDRDRYTDSVRHMRDTSPASQAEQDAFANRWGIDANEHLRNAGKKRGPNQALGDEVRWGDSKIMQFAFPGAGIQAVDIDQIIDITAPARVWALHLALTMMAPIEMPVGDNVAAFYVITTGVGASTIRFRRFLDNTSFVKCPIPGGLVQDVAELVVPDMAAKKILIGARVQYNNAAGVGVTRVVRIDAAAAPVMR